MDETAKPRLWRGPPVSVAHAESIIGWAAWPFFAIATFRLIELIEGVGKVGLDRLWPEMLVYLVLAVAAFAVVTLRRVEAAVFLFVFVLGLDGFGVFRIVMMSRASGAPNPLSFGLFVPLWAVMTFQCWRAIGAARALPRLRAPEAFD